MPTAKAIPLPAAPRAIQQPKHPLRTLLAGTLVSQLGRQNLSSPPSQPTLLEGFPLAKALLQLRVKEVRALNFSRRRESCEQDVFHIRGGIFVNPERPRE